MRLGWLVAAVLLAPLAAFPADLGISIAQAKNAAFIVLGLGGVCVLVRNPWVRAFLAWAVVTFVASGMRVWGMAGLLGLLAWALVFQAAMRLDAISWGRLRWAIAGAALFQVAWMGLQALGHDPLFAPLSYRGDRLSGPVGVMGWFGNPMDAALFLSLSLPAVWATQPWLAVPVGAAILGLRARIGLVTVLILGGWLAWRHGGTKLRAAVAILGGALAIGYGAWWDPRGLGFRLPIWQNGWQLGWASPWLGWGANAVGYRLLIFFARTNEHWDFLFSEWLQGFVEFGVVGVGLAVGYVGHLLWRLRDRWRMVGENLLALAILLAASAVSIPFRIGPVALLSALYLGRLEWGTRQPALGGHPGPAPVWRDDAGLPVAW